ncbi:MAG: discoidin domain-containing protein [Alistipes sp.]|nr:discoidin domain-containing protein [Alistipes sp.]
MNRTINFRLLFALLPALLAIACSKDSGSAGVPDPVTEADAGSCYGRIILSWRMPASYDYMEVIYTDPVSCREVIFRATEQYAQANQTEDGKCRLNVDGYLDREQHEFTLVSYNSSGEASVPVTVSGSALDPAFTVVGATLSLRADYGGAILGWQNVTGMPVVVSASFTDRYGKSVTVIEESDSDGELRLGSIAPSGATIHATVYDITQTYFHPQQSYPDFVPLPEEDLSAYKGDWTVIFCNDEPLAGQWGPEWLLDGDIDNTIWHTSVVAAFPVYAVFDTGLDMVISTIGLTPRQGDGFIYGPRTVRIEVSEDNERWEEAGFFDFDGSTDDTQYFYLNQKSVRSRYFKLTLVESYGEPYAYLSELWIYGGIRE